MSARMRSVSSVRQRGMAVIVALHGVNDSRAAFRLAGPWWAEQGIETWAVDQRGFGEAPGRGVWAGEARMAEDLRTAVALVPQDVALFNDTIASNIAFARPGARAKDRRKATQTRRKSWRAH